jgi:hypothetical protein
MAGLKRRLSSQGITPEQFFFQFVVVLLGVYLAILVEGKAEDRSRAEDARVMLAAVLAELDADELEIREMRETHLGLQQASEDLLDLLAIASPAEDGGIRTLLTGALLFNPTVFPRRAAYSGLVASGNIGYISNPELPLSLANLYEHHYVRLQNMGEWTDRIMEEVFWPTANAEFWDRQQGQLREHGREANIGFWNLVDQKRQAHSNYVLRLDAVLIQVQDLKESIQGYLDS